MLVIFCNPLAFIFCDLMLVMFCNPVSFFFVCDFSITSIYLLRFWDVAKRNISNTSLVSFFCVHRKLIQNLSKSKNRLNISEFLTIYEIWTIFYTMTLLKYLLFVNGTLKCDYIRRVIPLTNDNIMLGNFTLIRN